MEKQKEEPLKNHLKSYIYAGAAAFLMATANYFQSDLSTTLGLRAFYC